VQLSIDETQPASFHYEIGRRIAPLREEGGGGCEGERLPGGSSVRDLPLRSHSPFTSGWSAQAVTKSTNIHV